eukprot:CAMPEP_0117008202 /NCGR_PEP_ID=MMETSP0472-20121206/7801_1 /TAXON_ID=693140 ORGANISM="Tiarina fusus, Strain LIS" /NCGR_SAMPLE_ID=MMETSP0472 /ASSEMBLY_ACC=CAM_ASM_000603 /LENGTH=392 /DNA_ID=CAMNT_0004710173 /DNA_START=114 /DNA_END=1292 /DNA_ORIENTATION=+
MLSQPSSRVAVLLIRRGTDSAKNRLFTTVSASATSPITTTLSWNAAQTQQHSHHYHYHCHTKQRQYHSTPGTFEKTNRIADSLPDKDEDKEVLPGSKAFLECDRAAVIDLFHKYSVYCDDDGDHLDKEGLRQILQAVGENPDQATLDQLYEAADLDGNGVIELSEFLHSSDMILGGAPAGIVLVVGGPGSGKGLLSKRLVKECGVVHLSSGDLLREEVRRETVLGKEVRDIMARGELVSSAVIVTLMRRRMRNHPGKRVLLDGFPRSLQNASDLVELCGKPELALHIECDDTILLERILARSANEAGSRDDDNIHTALTRIRTYHKYQNSTMEWLREQHVPVVNLDGSGTAENVWEQLTSIGRLMRGAVVLNKPNKVTDAKTAGEDDKSEAA